MHITVDADGRTITRLIVEYNATCSGGGVVRSSLTVTGRIAITSSRTFTVETRSADGTTTLNLQAQFDTLNNVSGTFRRRRTFTPPGGTARNCDTGVVTFSGRRQ